MTKKSTKISQRQAQSLPSLYFKISLPLRESREHTSQIYVHECNDESISIQGNTLKMPEKLSTKGTELACQA
jgi:hypothetical protein